MLKAVLVIICLHLSSSQVFKCTQQYQNETSCPDYLSYKVCGTSSLGFQAMFETICLACSHSDIKTFSFKQQCADNNPDFQAGLAHQFQITSKRLDWNVLRVSMNRSFTCPIQEPSCSDKPVCNGQRETFKASCQACNNKSQNYTFGECDQTKKLKNQIPKDLFQAAKNSLAKNRKQNPNIYNQIISRNNKEFTETLNRNRKLINLQFKNLSSQNFIGTTLDYESRFDPSIPKAVITGEWYACPNISLQGCKENQIIVCGTHSTNVYYRTFVDYCVACIHPKVQYFAIGRCPTFQWIIITSSFYRIPKNQTNVANSELSTTTTTTLNSTLTNSTNQKNITITNETVTNSSQSNIKTKTEENAENSKPKQPFFPLIQCKTNQNSCKKQTVCGIFKDGYRFRQFSSACQACRHPKVKNYRIANCPQEQLYPMVQYKVVPQDHVPLFVCGQAQKLNCVQNTQLCGVNSEDLIIQINNLCIPCKTQQIVKYIKSNCNSVPLKIISSAKLERAITTPITFGFASQSKKAQTYNDFRLQVEGNRTTNPCLFFNRKLQSCRQYNSKQPVCGYWSSEAFIDYDSMCQACSEMRVLGYSYGKCITKSKQLVRIKASYYNVRCIYPLRGLGLCDLSPNPVCVRTNEGYLKSFLNVCIACNSGITIMEIHQGAGCHSIVFTAQAIIGQILQYKQ